MSRGKNRAKPAHSSSQAPSASPDVERGGPLHVTALFLAAVGVGGAPLLPSVNAEPAGVMALALLALLGLLAWLVHAVTRCRRSGRDPVVHGLRLALPMALLLVVMALATFAAQCVRPGIMTLCLWIGSVALFVLLAQLLRDGDTKRFILAVLFASVLVVALHGLHQKFIDLPAARKAFAEDPAGVMRRLGLPPHLEGDMVGRMGQLTEGTKDRVFSTFLQPTTLSGFFALTLPLFAAWLLALARRGKRHARWLALGVGGAGLAAMLWCFAETRSKGGLLAMGSAAGFVALWAVWRTVKRLMKGRPAARIRLTFAGVVLALAALGVGVFAAGVATGKLPPWRDFVGSFVVRAGYWRAGAAMAVDHPVLGIGPGNFPTVFTQYLPPAENRHFYAHNDYIQSVSEIGLAAIVIIAWMIAAIYRRGFKKLKDKSRLVRGVTLGALSGITAILVHSIFDFNLHIPANALLFSALVALAVSPVPVDNQ